MKTSKEKKREPKTPQLSKRQPQRRLRIVKLEGRIAPRPIPTNHNQTLVRDRCASAP
jgi:hypothetical protein